MAWNTLSSPTVWHTTGLDLLKRIQYMLLENGVVDADGATLFTTMFTQQQWIDALNQRQEQFLRDTYCVVVRASQATTPQVGRYALPNDWIHTRRLSWQEQGGQLKALGRTDAFALDHQLIDWQQNFAIPTEYNDGSDLPTLTVELAKAPSDIGTMFLSYVAQPTTLTGQGVPLSVPDECETALLYGALADLLGQEGEAQDPQRAAYCEQRYQLTVQMTRMLLEGSSA